MKTIRGKLLIYFFVFLIFFQVTAISIFVSSNRLTNVYNDSFERFLLLNSISQKSKELHTYTNTFVIEQEDSDIEEYFTIKKELVNEKKQLIEILSGENNIEIENYANLIETFIHETELTMGFVFLNHIEQYTYHLEEARKSSRFIQEATLELIDAELTAYQSFYNDMQLRNDSFMLFIIFLFLTTSMLAIFFALWFSRGITSPLAKLSSAAKEVAAGDLLGAPIDIRSNDELQLLGETFNNMRSNIHGLIEEIKDQSELDRLLKEMELKHLQSQINPHFLFNTLNTLSNTAYLEDAKSTSSLIDSVAALLRHNLGQIEKSVTLADEVEVVKGYFHIQKTRFSERIEFIISVEETCLDIMIPRLTLQPLVENAFIHGIEEREEGGTISLEIYPSQQSVIIEVADDGQGIPKDKITQIMDLSSLKQEHVGHSTGIGLRNVIRRLQLFYQMQNPAEIISAEGEGTMVRLCLPRKNK